MAAAPPRTPARRGRRKKPKAKKPPPVRWTKKGFVAAQPAPSRRTRPGAGCSVKERVEWIVHLMARGEWYGNGSLHELSEAWAVSFETVKKQSATASLFLEIDSAELARERQIHMAFAERIRREALEQRSKITGLPDFASALKANEQAAKFKGIDIDALPGAGGGGGAQTALRVVVDGGEPADAAPTAAPAVAPC